DSPGPPRPPARVTLQGGLPGHRCGCSRQEDPVNQEDLIMRQSLTALVAIVGLMLVPSGAIAEKHVPSGTVKLHGKSVSAGVGWSWGKGTLHYKGKNYTFDIDGLSVGSVGASEIDTTGEVYHLN